MKKMKRFVALALSVVMVLAMSVMASAATVTVDPDLSGHTFLAYQIFTGTQATDDSTELGDVKWGNGIDSTNFLNALKADETLGSDFSKCTTVNDVKSVVEALAKIDSNSAKANVVAKIAFANKMGAGTSLTTEGDNDLASGYYLIVDNTSMTDDKGNKKDHALNAALLRVTDDNIDIEKKTDKPSVEKKVKENSKDLVASEDNVYGDKYNDVADYNMGDNVSFHLIGTVPDMSRYDTYKYIFHDTLSAGLTPPEGGSVRVYLCNAKERNSNNDKDITEEFQVSVSGQEITVSCDNLKVDTDITKGKYIIVEYSAKLNQNAVVGLNGNENKVYLEYSNKPDQSGTGDNNTGKTPEDKVIVFTYQLETTKVDKQDENIKLQGAEFKLKNSGNKWAQVDANGKVTGWVDNEESGSTLTSNDNGVFSVIGLDDGTYYLKETKAPAGYNTLVDPITFIVDAATTNSQGWAGNPNEALTAISIKVGKTKTNGSIAEGKVGIKVENTKGSNLPSTGGIGTTIFYIVGGILMVGAAVLLITKRRAEN